MSEEKLSTLTKENGLSENDENVTDEMTKEFENGRGEE